MSIFDFPRIHFQGTQLVNPGTGNNNSASPGTEFTVTSDTERVAAVADGRSDAEFAAWIAGADPNGLVRGQWNLFGDMGFRFQDVRIRAVQIGPKDIITDPSREPLVGGSVELTAGVVCDMNPEGFDTTQIFAEALQITAPEAIGGSGTFLSRRPSRAMTRSLNWFRNVSFHGSVPQDDSSGGAGGASAGFHSAILVEEGDLKEIPEEGYGTDELLHRLVPRRVAGSPNSKGIAALWAALQRPDVQGLVVRYNLYLTYPRISDPELVKRFATGERTENPAIGQVVGTIAPWMRGEPTSVVLGRQLKSAQAYVNPWRTNKPYFLAPAVCRVDAAAKQVAIDLSNTMPENGADGAKWDMGAVRLGFRKPTPPGADPAGNGGPITWIGELANTRTSYETMGGLCDLSYAHLAAEEQARLEGTEAELVLETAKQSVLMYEPAYQVAAESTCNYMEAAPGNGDGVAPAPGPGLDPALTGSVTVHLRHRGRVPAGTVTVGVEQWKFTPTGDPRRFGTYLDPTSLGLKHLYVERGAAVHELDPKDGPGVRMWRYVPPGYFPAQLAPKVLPDKTFEENFCFVRVLPWDDFSGLRDEDLTFELIYKSVLRYYSLILPAMSKRLDMSDAALWRSPAAARYLLRTTDPKEWGRWAYMPRTRDLSAPRRALLHRWCRKILAEHGETADVG